MQKSTVISIIKDRIGNRDDLDAEIGVEMDLNQVTRLERNGRIIPWFLETEVASITTTIGEERVPLPSDFLSEKETGGLFLYVSSASDPWIRLDKDDYDILVLTYQDNQAQPEKYSLGGSYFRLKPTPDAAYTLKMIYLGAESLPSSGGDSFENAWLKYAPDVVIAEVAKVMAEKYLQDFELGATFDKDITRAWDRIFVETEAQKHVNRRYSMGDN